MASLNYQFMRAMQACTAYGESKRSYRAQTGADKLDKIFSHSEYESVAKTSKNFAQYLKTEYRISRVDAIRPAHVDAYLRRKAATCNNNTLTKVRTHIESLGLFCAKIYGTVEPGNFTPSERVEGSRANNVKVGRPMPDGVFARLVGSMEGGGRASERDALALRVVRYTGLRLDEVCTQKVADCHPDERGRFGFGYIDVSNGKHGRPRRVHLHSGAARDVVREACAKASGDTLVSCKAKTLGNRISVAMKAIGAADTAYLGAHSIRKLYAQDFYDWYRARHTKRETIAATNTQLGHGEHRSVAELKTYVAHIY